MNGLSIKEGDKIGINGGEISVSGEDDQEIVEKLLQNMVDEDSELITLFYGNGTTAEDAALLKSKLEADYPEHEIEIHYGGQPHYSYYISVE